MTSAQVVETSAANNSSFQNYPRPPGRSHYTNDFVYHCQNDHETESGRETARLEIKIQTICRLVFHVLHTMQNLDISRWRFVEDGKEMYQKLQRTSTAIVLLIKSFV